MCQTPFWHSWFPTAARFDFLQSTDSPSNWVAEWASRLAITYGIISGLTKGFCIGHDRKLRLCSSSSNIQRANEHPELVTACLQTQREQQTLLGPCSGDSMLHIHTSRFRVIPDFHQPGGEVYCMVVVLSPAGWSVNVGIPSELAYILAHKWQIRHQEQTLAHPKDRYLLGIVWDNMLYVDVSLPSALSLITHVLVQ